MKVPKVESPRLVGQHAVDIRRLEPGIAMALRTAQVPSARVVLPEPRV